MTTFAGWLSDQTTRQDAVGEIARLWAQISPGRTHSVAGVTKAITDHAEHAGLLWVPDAIAATAEEYRVWKVNPEAASIAAPQTRSQLDRIEGMLARLLDSLGIPLEDPPQLVDTEQAGAEVIVMHEQGGDVEFRSATAYQPTAGVVPHIGPNGLEMRPASSLAGVEASLIPPGTFGPDGKPNWAVLYGASSRDLPEDAELGEQAE